MKKLYAKASFKSKKPTKNGKAEVAGSDAATPHNGSIILAYQSNSNSNNNNNNHGSGSGSIISSHPVAATDNARNYKNNNNIDGKYTYKPESTLRPAAAPPPPPPSSSSSAASAAHPFARSAQTDEAHYYYSIQELQQLNMLDHRHPYYHRQQQQQLLLPHTNGNTTPTSTATPTTTPSPCNLPYYEHHKLVLQLPMAAAAADAPTVAATCAAPIYEAPQMAVSDDGNQNNNNNNTKNNSNSNTLPLLSAVSRRNGFGAGATRSLDYRLPAQQQQRYDDAAHFHAYSAAADSSSAASFGSLPIVDAVDDNDAANDDVAATAARCYSSLPFNKLRKLQHTHSLPSIRMSQTLRSADAGGGGVADNANGQFDYYVDSHNNNNNVEHDDDDDDDDEGGFNQPTHCWQRVAQQQQQQQPPFQPQLLQSPSRHNSLFNVGVGVAPPAATTTPMMMSCAAVSNFYAEQSIIGARASVMVYDDNQKRWLPSGTSSGLSKVQIYHHQQNNTFRIVGRKLQDHEVVINCSILKGLKYNQATPTFHQWRDSKFVYGLNFSSQNDAEAFARAMVHALDVLSGRVANNPIIGAVGVGGQPTNGNGYEEDMGYRTMTSEDAAILRQQQQITGQITPSAQTPTSQTNQNNIPQSPPTPQGHHRTSRNSLSAPAAPQPQQMTIPQQQQPLPSYGQPITQNGLQQQQQPQQPQIPPAPGQTQYHAPQQMQQQQQSVVHPVYSTQQLVNAGYPQQNQYQPPAHFMLSNSNPNLNLHQYSQSQQCIPSAPQPPMPPPHQNGVGGGGNVGGSGVVGPIYVSTSQSQPALPTSASANSVVYGSHQQQQQQQQQQQLQLQQQQQQPPQAPQPPPQPTAVGLQNGGGGGGGSVGVGAPPPPPPPPYGQAPQTMGAAPPAPMPPPSATRIAPQAPAAPPPPPNFGSAPPPPPPPPSAGGGAAAKKEDPQAELMGSLAAQLQQAKLKKNKTSTLPLENSGSSTSSGGSNYGTIGRSSTGMASMMDEMAKTLARRRAQAEKKEPDPEPEVKQRPWEKSNTLPHKLGGGSSASNTNCSNNSNNTSNSGGESPRPMRKRFGSASEETILKQVNGDGLSLAMSSSELDTLKSEILREIRVEIQKVKCEIIDVIKSEFNRR